MRRNNNLRIVGNLLLILSLLLPTGCEKETEPMIYAPTLATNSASGLSRYEAVLIGSSIEHPKSIEKCKVGFLYAESSSMNGAQEVAAVATDGNQYTATLRGLTVGKMYYYCIYATTGYTLVKGNVIAFSTLASEAPLLTNPVIVASNENSATLTSGVTDDGGSDLSDFGFVYKMKTESDVTPPTENDIVKNAVSSLTAQEYTVELTELKANTTYLIRSYAKNKTGKTGYGTETIELTTDELKIPKVTCDAVTGLSAYTALVRANITTDNGFAVKKRGFCLSTENQFPTVDNLNEEVALGATSYSKQLETLNANTKYYLRAYAINDKGTGYSSVVEFTTHELQVVTFEAPLKVENITISSATISCAIQVPVGTEIQEKGVCYSIFSTKPGIDMEGGPKRDTETAGNAIKKTIDGLTEGTNYYVTTYAKTLDGYFYSDPISFHTTQTHVPTLAVPTISNIGETGATVKTNVTNNGGRDIQAIGFSWSNEVATPNIADNDHLVETKNQESYTGSMTNLKKGTKYYVRAYARNVNGETYSQAIEFTTLQNSAPEVEDMVISNIEDESATAQATIANIGGLEITSKGFVWSDASNATPTLEAGNHLGKIDLGKGGANNSTFTTVLKNLTRTTRYYIRAYAINEKGTTYSTPISFRTTITYTPSVEYPSVANVTANTADMSANISNDGGSNVTEVGFCWSEKVSNPVIDEAKKNFVIAPLEKPFSTTIKGLKAATNYYVRAYAKNKNGISYSSGYSNFVTLTTTPGLDDNPTPGTHVKAVKR